MKRYHRRIFHFRFGESKTSAVSCERPLQERHRQPPIENFFVEPDVGAIGEVALLTMVLRTELTKTIDRPRALQLWVTPHFLFFRDIFSDESAHSFNPHRTFVLLPSLFTTSERNPLSVSALPTAVLVSTCSPFSLHQSTYFL